MTFELERLIAEASTELGSAACRAGKHDWEAEGGRPCGHDDCEGHRSQPVYRCRTCGAWDYGEPGGPGAADCARFCHRSS